MYNFNKIINTNNIKGGDIIRTVEKKIAFAGGMTMGLLYKKYERDFYKYMKKATKKLED